MCASVLTHVNYAGWFELGSIIRYLSCWNCQYHSFESWNFIYWMLKGQGRIRVIFGPMMILTDLYISRCRILRRIFWYINKAIFDHPCLSFTQNTKAYYFLNTEKIRYKIIVVNFFSEQLSFRFKPLKTIPHNAIYMG